MTEITDSLEKEEPKAKAEPKPKAKRIAPGQTVSGKAKDPIAYSRARVPGPTENRKSLTVLHIQRRLVEEGFPEASASMGGTYDHLTTRAVWAYQESLGDEGTGTLTRAQFALLFEGDPNVDLAFDTPEDH